MPASLQLPDDCRVSLYLLSQPVLPRGVLPLQCPSGERTHESIGRENQDHLAPDVLVGGCHVNRRIAASTDGVGCVESGPAEIDGPVVAPLHLHLPPAVPTDSQTGP